MNNYLSRSKNLKILNLNIYATKEEIKVAYKKLALIHHPDKGGDPEKFKLINEAFNELNNNNLNPEIRGKDTEFNLEIKLKEAYLGCTKKLTITRKKLKYYDDCITCLGKGCFDLGLVNIKCSDCLGTGKNFLETSEVEIIKINIEKGIKNGEKIILQEKGDDILNGIPGDIIVIIKIKADKKFKKINDDLYIDLNINLCDALCGGNISFKHIDNRIIKINSDTIIKPFEARKIKWKSYENSNCKLTPTGKAPMSSKDEIIKAIEIGYLKDKNITSFAINKEKKICYFFTNELDEINVNKVEDKYSDLFIKNINECYCLEKEGMINKDSSELNGNLYIKFKIIYPDKISVELKEQLLNSELPKCEFKETNFEEKLLSIKILN